MEQRRPVGSKTNTEGYADAAGNEWDTLLLAVRCVKNIDRRRYKVCIFSPLYLDVHLGLLKVTKGACMVIFVGGILFCESYS